MAYGNYCSVCGGTVDNNEFDYLKDICKECAIEEEQREVRATEARKLLSTECEQMELEDMICESS